MLVLKKTRVHGLCLQYLYYIVYNQPGHFLGYAFPFLNNAGKNVRFPTGDPISPNNQSLKTDYHEGRPTGW